MTDCAPVIVNFEYHSMTLTHAQCNINRCSEPMMALWLAASTQRILLNTASNMTLHFLYLLKTWVYQSYCLLAHVIFLGLVV